MKLISTLLPAESVLIIEGKNSSINELLKITFMDLLLKQVLEIQIISKQAHSREKIRHYKYIIRGQNFSKYKFAKHELVFLNPYFTSSSIKILFQHLIRMGFQNAVSEKHYIKLIKDSKKLEKYFKENYLQFFFGGFSMSSKGIEIRTKLKLELELLEIEILTLINNGDENTFKSVTELGGNILLLKTIDFALIKQFDEEILAEINRKYSSDGSSGCYGCSVWSSGCTSSGCSSSGCSGCGGGGCGGCGGGCS